MYPSNCPYCGGSLRFIKRTAYVTRTDHHNHVYECGECGRTVIGG